MSSIYKIKMPSAAQAKRIAICWAQNRPINMMTAARDGGEIYNDPTSVAMLKHGWTAPDGLEHSENGYRYVPHKLTAAALVALECYLNKTRLDAAEESSGRARDRAICPAVARFNQGRAG